MKALNPEICFKLREARRLAGLSQHVLAAEVGCKQSALSMFEQGQPTKLSGEVVEKLAKKLGVDLAAASSSPSSSSSPVFAPGSGLCPNPQCPSNRAYQVGGRVLYSPDRAAADPIGGRFCAVCGELLERFCPSCGAPVHAGAVCSLCGQPYICG